MVWIEFDIHGLTITLATIDPDCLHGGIIIDLCLNKSNTAILNERYYNMSSL